MTTLKRYGIMAILALSLALPGPPQSLAAEQRATAKDGKTIIIKILAPKDAFELLKQNKDNQNFVILDIRTPEEFESGYIEGAVNMNYHSEAFVADLDKLDKTKTYFVYCRTGRRSRDAVGIMVQQGFSTIYRVQGDIVRWKKESLPVIKK